MGETKLGAHRPALGRSGSAVTLQAMSRILKLPAGQPLIADRPIVSSNTRGQVRIGEWPSGSGAVWGTITGTLGDQVDVQDALDDKEASGVAASAVVAHEAASNPHAQYLTPAEADALYDAAGDATAAVAAHEAAGDPHPGYLTSAEADAAYQGADATLAALAGLSSSAGLVEQTGADAFTKRALGVASSTDVPTRADADVRYAAASHSHGGGGVTVGTATLDFGAFPGASDASVAVTGQTGIASGSVVSAWIQPSDTADHSADEHMLESIKVFAGSISDGVGFTVYGFNTSEINEPSDLGMGLGRFSGAGAAPGRGKQDPQAGRSTGGGGTRLYGQYTVAWSWA